MTKLIRTAAQIIADVHAQGGDEPDTTPPSRNLLADEPRARGVIDIDMGVGRLTVGWDDIRRYARVWSGEAPPEEPLPNKLRRGCPSEGQYRRHLAAGEKCGRCRAHTLRLWRARRAKRRERRAGAR